MGDMADMVNDGHLDDWEENSVNCKYCGEGGFRWVHTLAEDGAAWRLADEEGYLHYCGGGKPKVDRSLGHDWSSKKKAHK